MSADAQQHNDGSDRTVQVGPAESRVEQTGGRADRREAGPTLAGASAGPFDDLPAGVAKPCPRGFCRLNGYGYCVTCFWCPDEIEDYPHKSAVIRRQIADCVLERSRGV